MIAKLYKKVIPGIIGRSKKQVRISVILFIAGIILGYIVLNSGIDVQELLIAPMQQKFGVSSGESISKFSMLISIFFNNIKVALLLVFTGWIFGIMPVFTAFFNGAIIGVMLKFIKLAIGVSPFKTLLTLLPHGILEIPALIIMCALTMKTGAVFFKALRKKVPFKDFGKSMVEMVTSVIFLILPAFLLAAIVETFISSPLAAIVIQRVV